MLCFGGAFLHWLRDLGGLGDSGGSQSLRSNGVLIAPRCVPASGGCRHPDHSSVPGSWWSRRGVPAGQYPVEIAGVGATMSWS